MSVPTPIQPPYDAPVQSAALLPNVVRRRVVIPVEELERNVLEPLLDQPPRSIQSNITPVSPTPQQTHSQPIQTLRTRIRLD